MIQVDTILRGPELDRRPISAALQELSKWFRALDALPDYSLELLYIVSGSLGKAEFEGFKIGARSASKLRLRILIAVPDDIAADEDPRDALIALAARGVRTVQSAATWFPVDQAVEALTSAAMRSSDTHNRASINTREGDTADETSAWPLAGVGDVQVELRVDADSGRVQEVLSFESRLGAILSEYDIGILDGNEVGSGQVAWFVVTRNLDRLLEVVVPVIEALPGARTLHVLVADDAGTRAVLRLRLP